MRASVDLEDVVIEVFDPQAEAGHAQVLDRAKLRLGQCSRLALKSDLFGLVPWQNPLHRIDEAGELARRNIRWSAAAKINKLRFSAADERPLRVELQLLNGRIQISLDLRGVFIGVDLEVAKVAAFTAKRDMNVNS